MDFKICNIGIISDSSIKLNGLTVITGSNNSGKTTVGKTLYALSEAISDYQNKLNLERDLEIQRRLREVFSNLSFLRFAEDELHFSDEGMYDSSPLLSNFVKTGEIHRLPAKEIVEFSKSLFVEVTNLEELLQKTYNGEKGAFNYIKKKKNIIDFVLLRLNEIKVDLQTIEKMFTLKQDLKSLLRRRITRALSVEFKNQVQPAKFPNDISKIVLSDDVVFCDIQIENNVVKAHDDEMYYEMPYNVALLIDDAFVIDNTDYGRDKSFSQRDFDIVNCKIENHSKRLMYYLECPPQGRIVDSDYEEKYVQILELINKVVPGCVEQRSNGKYYVNNGASIRLTNLATGSKMVLILKQLIEKHLVTEKTLLILDEPEAHLHPEWQNLFAEMVCLLVKNIGTKVLLTTHSPNFMLALDGYMREKGIIDKCNFYITENIDEYRVNYRLINDDLNIVYDKFLRPFEYSNDVRKRYIYGEKHDK